MNRELMREVVEFDAFLESLFGIGKRLAIAAGAFGAIAVGLLMSVRHQIAQNPVEFLCLALSILLVGGSLGAMIATSVARRSARKQLRAGEEALKSLEETNALEMKRLEIRHSDEIGLLNAEHAREIDRIRSEHAREIERIRSEYEKQLSELRRPDEVRTPSGRLNVNLAAIRCTDHGIIAAAVAAFDDERHIIPLGKYEKAVRKSINNRDGMFVLSKTAFCGMPGDEDGRFYLTQTWFKGMDDHEIIDAMRSIAEKWEAAH